ncbi:Serine/threonine-protein phosphatase 7 long form [Glycine max]|nr:Serine/threonine-protein phosphatase 7 long form [Glycine max]
MLYREMCRSTNPDAKTMGGYKSLLQSWAWYYMLFIATRVNQIALYPLVMRWSGGGLSFSGTPHGDVISYRMRLDHMTAEQWTIFVDSSIWTACTPLIYFSIVECHQEDRVKLQFDLQQGIPYPPKNTDKLHKIDMRGRIDTN